MNIESELLNAMVKENGHSANGTVTIFTPV